MHSEEKRHFKRYEAQSECEVRLGTETYKGRIVDYSDGIGAVFENAQQLVPGKQVDIKVFEPEMEIKGEVVWVKKLDNELWVGFRRLDDFQGSLRNFALADLLMGLQKSKKTGILKVESDSIVKKVYIKNGAMIYASSNAKDDRLGKILLKSGRISPEDYNKAESLFKESGDKFGKILVDIGCLKPKETFLAVRYQIEQILLSLFAIEDGSFKFLEGPLPAEELITLRLSPSDIIYRGIKKVNNVQHIKQATPGLEAVLEISTSPTNIFQDVVLDEFDKIVLSHIDGTSSLNKILSLSLSSDSDTLRSICALLSIGMIVKREDMTLLPEAVEIEKTARLAEEKVAKEKSAKLAEEKVAKEKAAKLAEEKVAKEKATKLAEEKVAKEKAAKLAEEKVAKEKAAKLAEEKVAKEKATKLAEEKVAKEKSAKLAEEKVAKEKAARLAEEKVAKEKAAGLAKEKVAKEKAAGLAKEKSAKLAEEKVAKEKSAKLAEEKVAKEKSARLAEEIAAKEKSATIAASYETVTPEKDRIKKRRLYISVGITIAVVLFFALFFTFRDSGEKQITTTTTTESIFSQDNEKQLQAQIAPDISNKMPGEEETASLTPSATDKAAKEKAARLAEEKAAKELSAKLAEEKAAKKRAAKEKAAKKRAAKKRAAEEKAAKELLASLKPEKPTSKSLNERFMLYRDQFNNDAGGWEIFNTTMASARIEGGHYYIENKSKTGKYITLHAYDFPLDRKFIVEIAMKTVSASGNHSYGYVMGAKDAGNNYTFQISSNGFYSIKRYYKGIPQELASGKIRDMVFQKNSFNILKLEKLGSTIRFYINDNYLGEVSDLSPLGKRMGFIVEGKSEIAVDYTRTQMWSK